MYAVQKEIQYDIYDMYIYSVAAVLNSGVLCRRAATKKISPKIFVVLILLLCDVRYGAMCCVVWSWYKQDSGASTRGTGETRDGEKAMYL